MNCFLTEDSTTIVVKRVVDEMVTLKDCVK